MLLEITSCLVLLFALIVFITLYCNACKNYSILKDEIEREREEHDIVLDFLHKITEDVEDGADKGKIYRKMVRAVSVSCGAMSACVYESQKDGTLQARAVEGLFPPQKKVPPSKRKNLRVKFLESVMTKDAIDANEGIIGTSAHERKGVLIKDATKDPRVVKHQDPALKVSSMIVVPMIFQNELFGVIALANPVGEKSFSETDFSLAKSLAEQGALAINNANMLEAMLEKSKLDFDLRLASSVQRYLLPSSLPSSKALDFAVKYIPQQLIGGDFYDFINLPDGSLGVVVADVSGKGVSAAILMALCQTKIEYFAKAANGPAEALKMLNAEMVKVMREDMFITVIYAVISPDGKRVRLVRAGHEDAIIYRAELKKCEKIKSDGMAVGMVDSELFDETIEEISFELKSGDILVLFTDGITESLNANSEEFSREKLENMVENLHYKKSSEINNALISEVDKFSIESKECHDDITLLTIKKN